MSRQLLLLATAVQFLTRLPVPAPGWEEDRLARAMRWFGAVGLLVGALTGALWWAASVALPAPVAAGLAIAGGIWLTGALHEDGAADTADALGGHASRERALEIMRDSRIGTYGAAALILSVGLRWAALASLAPVEGALALVIAHSASRGLMVPATRLARYARPSGTAKGVGAGAGMGEFLLALAPGMILAAWIAPQTLVAVALGAGAGVLILGLLVRRLGGYTGDGLGAIQQAAEVTIMVALAGLLR